MKWKALFHFSVVFPSVQRFWENEPVVPQNKEFWFGIYFYFYFFRLNIPPFVPARTVLEGLESEDEQPVKHEILGVKVKRTTTTDGSSDSFLFFFQTTFLSVSCLTDFKQSETEESERTSGWPAPTVSHSTSGGGGPGWVFQLSPQLDLHWAERHCSHTVKNLLCSPRQEEKATTLRRQTTPALRRGCSATTWMEWKAFVTTMEELCGLKYVFNQKLNWTEFRQTLI